MMYPLAIASRLSGPSDRHSAVRDPGSSRQAGRPIRALAPASSSAVGVRPCAASRFQSCERACTLGSKAPPLATRQRSHARRTSKSSGETSVGPSRAACQRRNSLDAS